MTATTQSKSSSCFPIAVGFERWFKLEESFGERLPRGATRAFLREQRKCEAKRGYRGAPLKRVTGGLSPVAQCLLQEKSV